MSKNFIKIDTFAYQDNPEIRPVFIQKGTIVNIEEASFRRSPQSDNFTLFTRFELINGVGYSALLSLKEFMSTYFPEEV
jgi:hypothetical protein